MSKQSILIFGGILPDRYFHIDHWPDRGQDGYFSGETTFIGGCALNMAATVHNLGGQAQVVSALGNDSTAEEIRKYLKKNGLPSDYLVETEGETGSCLVFIEPDGERTFLTCTGVQDTYPKSLAQMLENTEAPVVGVTGYYLIGPNSREIIRSITDLKKRGAYVLFDPSPLAGDIPKDVLQQIVEATDCMTPNRTELAVLGGSFAIEVLTHQGKTLILKKGAEGGTVYTKDTTFDYKACNTTAIDTTGAGDSFAGALLYAASVGMDLKQAVLLAARCAAQTAGIHGPHSFWNQEDLHD